MGRSALVFTFLFTLIVSLSGQTGEEDLVRTAFDSYKTSILNDKGEKAVDFVDSRTIRYYGDMLDLAINADSMKIEKLSVLDKIMVFSIRHRTTKEDILSFDGKKLLVYSIKSGMVGKNSVMNNSIGEVAIDGDFATGQLVVNKQTSPISFHFYKEGGQWKLDLTSLLPASAPALKQMVEDSGQNEDEFIFTILEMITGRKPGPEIWQPVK